MKEMYEIGPNLKIEIRASVLKISSLDWESLQ